MYYDFEKSFTIRHVCKPRTPREIPTTQQGGPGSYIAKKKKNTEIRYHTILRDSV